MKAAQVTTRRFSRKPPAARVAKPAEAEFVAADDRQFVGALARGLDVLACFGSEPLGNQEIAARTGLPKSTVSRLTYTLAKAGYLRTIDELQKYALGDSLRGIARAFLAARDIKQIAEPHMQELANLARSSVALGERRKLRMEYVACARSDAMVAVQLGVGSRLPMAVSALGRAYLAAVDDARREELLTQIREYDSRDWRRVRAGVERALEDVAKRGFATSIGDWQPEVNAVAVPLLLPNAREPVAFNICGPAVILTRNLIEAEFGPRLVAMVAHIRAELIAPPG